MEINKDTIVNLLRQRGDHDKADQASKELPDKVDHETHSGLLSKFNVDPKELLGKTGGVGDKLGL